MWPLLLAFGKSHDRNTGTCWLSNGTGMHGSFWDLFFRILFLYTSLSHHGGTKLYVVRIYMSRSIAQWLAATVVWWSQWTRRYIRTRGISTRSWYLAWRFIGKYPWPLSQYDTISVWFTGRQDDTIVKPTTDTITHGSTYHDTNNHVTYYTQTHIGPIVYTSWISNTYVNTLEIGHCLAFNLFYFPSPTHFLLKNSLSFVFQS